MTGGTAAGERLRYSFEAGVVGTALWPERTDSPYGHPTEPGRLPIGAASAAELDELSAWFQSSVDWDYPPDPSPWSQDEKDRFNARARAALAALREELGPGWTVVDGFRPVD